MQQRRDKLDQWKETLDLDAPAKARIAKRRTLPKVRSPEEIRMEAHYKPRWKGSGAQNDEFSKPGILPAKVLNPWERDRALAPERSMKAPVGSKPIKIPQTSKEFGDPMGVPLPPRFTNTLEKNMQKFKDYVQNPHKHSKPKPIPNILHPRGFTPTNTIGADFRFAHTHMLPRSQSLKRMSSTAH
eukprot:CAMPEP_0204914098 /NCGR_PEP_ID=MMETSP1397-20131031/11928_1 /ASSEMBLY_ACC=CAM_ASM_000891 /TAXON_ID=49980 /ORGANISM="Climacostomum Climacostomum virens, Strain Stock W-24" /LENGTH=184 /DNA_ID=CAMNT_0052085503 /DNA_START=164 /DNA_END=718 /DNA_ORIENTATION=-